SFWKGIIPSTLELPKNISSMKQLSDETILNQLENDDVELLWTINYLGEKDQAFSYKTFQLTGSKELSTAFASFQKRHSQEAKGQVTYLSLTGVRKSALDECIKDEAPHKYQPDTGEMFTYTSANSEFFTQPLLVAVPKEEGFHIIQNPNSLVQHSAKYQNKLNDLYQMIYPPVAPINAPSDDVTYLMFDNGGVLDGKIVMGSDEITEDDLVIEEYDWGGVQVLVNGIQIVSDIMDLVTNYNYKVVFHSKNSVV
ncbi:hypothetical protein, partial [Legionella tucsonensis]